MYGLSVGVSRIGDTLPPQVYALLSGLNAATVGIVALAAVELSQKAITNKMTRILVFLGACAGLLYNALWYFPLLMFLGGLAAVIHDYRVLHGPVIWIARLICRGKAKSPDVSVEMAEAQRQDESHRGAGGPIDATPVPVAGVAPAAAAHSSRSSQKEQSSDMPVAQPETRDEQKAPRIIPQDRQINMSWKHGAAVLAMFIVSFIVFMVLRGTLPNPSLLYQLFANMYLAGTIIFGGGPVVIPLLREYVVVEGWVSPRDFLIGLAIIQAFPGPNFNFAVYLGGLTAIGGGYNSAVGAVLAYLGIFVPGLVTVYGEMGLWSALRSRRWVKSGLRGINASAVGLIYAAVYRLWQIGYIDQGFQSGRSLADDPWWVVVTATSYVGGYWFGLKPPVAIILGAVMGLIRYGVVTK
jgi:chromate transport protein ChrA